MTVDNLMGSRSTLFLFALLTLVCSRADATDQGKHLFLLSGQSNMKRFQHKQFFIPAVQAAYGADNVIVIKNAQGGQPISKWYKAWTSSEGEKPEKTGQLYDALINQVKEKTDGVEIKSVTFIWMQGEADVKAGYVDVYAKSFKGLLGQLEKRPWPQGYQCHHRPPERFWFEETPEPEMARNAQSADVTC